MASKRLPGCSKISGGGPPLLAKCSLEELEYSSGWTIDPCIDCGRSLATLEDGSLFPSRYIQGQQMGKHRLEPL